MSIMSLAMVRTKHSEPLGLIKIKPASTNLAEDFRRVNTKLSQCLTKSTK